MQGNFIMLQKDDLKQVVSELVEELVGKKPQADLTPEESDEYFTRDQVIFTRRRKSPHFWKLKYKLLIALIQMFNLKASIMEEQYIRVGTTI